MKSKFIIITAIFSVFLLMMIPSIPAVEHQTIKENVSADRAETIQFIKEKIKEYKDQGLDLQLILFKVIMACILVPLSLVLFSIIVILELLRLGFWN